MRTDKNTDSDTYSQVFRSLGIPIQQLPANYSPEEYGRRLLSESRMERGVSYAASTDYVVPQMVPNTSKDKK